MTTSTEATVGGSATSAPTVGNRSPQPWLVVTMATTAVIVFVTVRGIARGFEPIGDNALVEMRALDVFTSNHPWLGTWSSASVASGTDLNHPGPLLFDLFVLPVRLFGSRVGIAGGAAALNVAAVWGSVLAARRIGGSITALAAAVVTAALAWSLGSELLFDVWGPNILVLPAFALVMLAWAVFAGHGGALPWVVGVGSLCASNHVSYIVLAPALVVAGLVALFVRERSLTWARHGRSIVLAAIVGVVAWAQPMWEQLFGAGDGNLARLASSSGGEDSVRTGGALGLRLLGAVVAVPPAWVRPGYDRSIPLSNWVTDDGGRRLDTSGLLSLAGAIVGLVLVGLIVGVAVVLTRRLDDRTTSAGAAVLGLVVLIALVTTAITPLDELGVSPHKFRFLFPVGALAATVVVAAVLRGVDRSGPRGRAGAPLVVMAVGVVLSVATLPTYRPVAGPVNQFSEWSVVRSLRDQLGPLEDAGTVYFDLDGIAFAEPYSWPIMAEMARRGVPFQVERSGDVRQVGEGRAFDGPSSREPDTRMYYRTGDDVTVAPGATVIADADSGVPGSRVVVVIEPFVPDDGDIEADDGTSG